MPRIVCLFIVSVLCLSTVSRAQEAPAPAPPVDPSEGGGVAGGNAIRLGSATLTGSVWLDGTLVTGDVDNEVNDSLEIRRARLGLAGSLTPRIGWSLAGELTAQPALRNAFLLVRASDLLHIRVGQANPVSALERGSSPLQLELINRSTVTSELTGPPDIGITVMSGEPFKKWIGYALNLTNGAGYNRADDNDAKDVSGRVAITPPAVPGLMVVVSGSRGEQPTGLRTRAGVGVEYRTPVWRVMAERLQQTRDELPSSNGFFAMAAYRHRARTPSPHYRMLEFAVRVSVLNDYATAAGDPSGTVDDEGGTPVLTEPGIARTRNVQFGMNYYVNASTRLMGNIFVPIDERLHPGPQVLFRWQLQF